MSSVISTQIQLVSRPTGWPIAENFATVTVEYPDLSPGEVRVQNLFMSVDPYMRGRMNDTPSYIAPFQLNETMTGGAVGRVTDSADQSLPTGTLVLHLFGWRDITQGPASQFTKLPEVKGISPSAFLSVLGMTGHTAYVGLKEVGKLAPEETVFISGAAGSVGSLAGQIAHLLGAKKVIGSVGSAEKAVLARQNFNFDEVMVYRDGPIRELLPAAAPEGIDVYFDNVGGDHLEAALDVLNRNGRAALCGAISQLNLDPKPAGPHNMVNIIKNSLTLKGFTVNNYPHLRDEYLALALPWLQEGKLTLEETITHGIESAVDAFLGMMKGKNRGKMLVEL